MKKLVTLIIVGLFLTSCGGSTTNIYIYSNSKKDTLQIDSTSTIDTILIPDKGDSVDIMIEHEKG
jgi:hypothetical protein